MEKKLSRRSLFKTAGGIVLGGLAAQALLKTSPIVYAHSESSIDQVIEISMGEMYFQVKGQDKGAAIRVPANKVVRLKFKNEGTVLHDAHFGKDFDTTGRFFKNNLSLPFEMLELPAGGEAWITFQFADSHKGEWEIACSQLGHYEAGMKAPFVVE